MIEIMVRFLVHFLMAAWSIIIVVEVFRFVSPKTFLIRDINQILYEAGQAALRGDLEAEEHLHQEIDELEGRTPLYPAPNEISILK